jgi:hypothetical protein
MEDIVYITNYRIYILWPYLGLVQLKENAK